MYKVRLFIRTAFFSFILICTHLMAGNPRTNAPVKPNLSVTDFIKSGIVTAQKQAAESADRTEFLDNVKALLQTGAADLNRRQHLLQKINANQDRLHKGQALAFVMTEELSEYWYEDIPDSTLRLFTYDGHGNNITMTSKNRENNTWLSVWKEEMSYDARDNLSEHLSITWDNDNDSWVQVLKKEFEYDALNNLLKQNGYYKEDGNWFQNERVIYSYDENNNRLEAKAEWFDGDQWQDNWQTIFTYDSLNNLVEAIGKWSDGGILVNAWRDLYNYDATGQRIGEMYKWWEDGQWINSEYNTLDYDENGNHIALLSKMWDGDNWVNSYRADLTYNEFNNQTATQGFSWRDGQWRNTTRITFEYDDNQNHTMYLFEQNWELEGFSPFHRYTRVYEQFVTGLEELYTNNPTAFELKQNYPNPFNPQTHIEFDVPQNTFVEVTVFNILGEEIRSLVNGTMPAGVHKKTWNGKDADGSAVPSGVYFARVDMLGQSKSIKMTLIK